MADKIVAQAQAPFFLYRLLFKDPLFDLQKLDDVAAKAAFTAFRQWDVSLEHVTFKDDAKNLAEEATNFTLFGGRATFSIAPGGCALGVVNPNWSEAGVIAKIAMAGTGAVLNAVRAEADRQFGSIIMHLTPAAGTIGDLTAKFIKFDVNKLVGQPQCYGFSVHRDDLLWVVDKSAAFQNSLFVRMDRWFRSEDSFEHIAIQLRDDETKVLDLLGLEVE